MGGYWRTACAFITRPTSSRAPYRLATQGHGRRVAEILWGDPAAVGDSGEMLEPTGQQRSLACFIRASVRHVESDTIPFHRWLQPTTVRPMARARSNDLLRSHGRVGFDAEWGERNFHLLDPDGHELSFATPLEN